jgi:hypothetical protein
MTPGSTAHGAGWPVVAATGLLLSHPATGGVMPRFSPRGAVPR